MRRFSLSMFIVRNAICGACRDEYAETLRTFVQHDLGDQDGKHRCAQATIYEHLQRTP
jgi:hypothetical protein